MPHFSDPISQSFSRAVQTFFLMILALLSTFLLTACGRDDAPPPATPSAEQAPRPTPAGSIELLFAYGSEKESWVNDVTAAFHASAPKIRSGKSIRITARPMGSGESIDEILTGTTRAHLVSPASAAFITLGNAQSRAKSNTDLVGPTENLVLSPVVIAMWRPMAEALGWPGKPLGWSDILTLAKDPGGWSKRGHGEWGSFKFGHTHPEYSNSGLISALAEVHAGAGKRQGLTISDVNNPATAKFVRDIEQSVVHYGSSTGFFGKKMFANGPAYVSATVLYENMVIESYGLSNRDPSFPVIAIYPKEGTFWSDHPVGIVQRDWVTPEHQEAARIYIDFLLARPQQERALTFGFRPANPQIALAAPIDAEHGVNPKEPQNILPVPEADVMNAIIELWRTQKKPANIVLVLDRSGSMNEDNKMAHAKAGASELIKMLGEQDQISLLPFSSDSIWAGQQIHLKTGRQTALTTVGNIITGGGTKLFDSVDTAYQYLLKNPQPNAISAIVVLTDGADTESQMKLPELLSRIRGDNERKSIRVFTIGYGKDARADELKKIADETQARYFQGKPENIRQVFKDIATFF